MSYVIYALFQVPGTAETALQDLSLADIPKNDYKVFVHKKKLNEDLRASETDGKKGLALGVGIGAVVGALFAWVLCVPLHLFKLPSESALGLGLFLGVICGALGGGIYGSGLLHHSLQRLVSVFQPGQTLVTAEIETPESRDRVDQIFKKHGAIETTR
jgi:hypothetical protein